MEIENKENPTVIKKKKVTIVLGFDEREFDLDIITEEWVKRIVKDQKMGFMPGEGPEVESVTVEEIEEPIEGTVL